MQGCTIIFLSILETLFWVIRMNTELGFCWKDNYIFSRTIVCAFFFLVILNFTYPFLLFHHTVNRLIDIHSICYSWHICLSELRNHRIIFLFVDLRHICLVNIKLWIDFKKRTAFAFLFLIICHVIKLLFRYLLAVFILNGKSPFENRNCFFTFQYMGPFFV